MIYRIFIINLLDVVFILYIYCVNLVNFDIGSDCVMLMLCLGIACIRVYFPIGFTRASIRDNVYCTLFFILRLPVATE